MRALILANHLDRCEQRILTDLHRSGIDLHIMMNPEGPSWEAVQEAGLSAEAVVFRSRMDLRAAASVRQRLRQGGFDLLHGLVNRPLANGLLAARGLPLARVAYRGTMGHLHRLDPASWLTYFHPALDRIVCVSEAVRQYLLEKGLPPDRLVTIYKGHDPAWYRGEAGPTRADLGIPNDRFLVGCAAALRPVKGIEYLIRSLDHLPPDLPAALLLIGEVRDARIRRLADAPHTRDRVHLLGYRADAPAILGQCDAAAMCSVEREGLPRAMIEAMAQGVPGVVTRVGGMPELVQDGVSGLVVPPRNAEAIAEAIRRLAADAALRRRMGAAAAERIRTEFHIARTVEAWAALYRSLTK